MQEKQHKILVIDDDPRLIHVMTSSLITFGRFAVITAVDGAQGLEQCQAEHPDAVVVDVRMPQLDGYQVVRALRGDPTTKDLPLIILSALVQERDKIAGMLSGVDLYLEKPIEPVDLVQAIRDTIQISHQQRQERMLRFADESDDA